MGLHLYTATKRNISREVHVDRSSKILPSISFTRFQDSFSISQVRRTLQRGDKFLASFSSRKELNFPHKSNDQWEKRAGMKIVWEFENFVWTTSRCSINWRMKEEKFHKLRFFSSLTISTSNVHQQTDKWTFWFDPGKKKHVATRTEENSSWRAGFGGRRGKKPQEPRSAGTWWID